jgi:thioredoxin 1
VQLHHFAELPRRLAHAVCILRFSTPVGVDAVRALTEQLTRANVLEDLIADVDGSTCFVAGAWVPRTDDAHAAAIEHLRGLGELVDGAWFFATTTTIDAIAADDDDPDHDEREHGDLEVSHWRHGEPPGVTAVPFALEGYPEILEEFDGDDFGLALKLGAPARAGERTVLRAMHQVWIRSYIDRRVEEQPMRNASVAFDPVARAAILWVDEFAPPATVAQMVHHLLWIAAAIHEIVPIAHGRFAGASMEQKYGEAMGLEGPPTVLAGNPLRALLADDAASAEWLASQTLWSKRELASMFVEAGTDLDPDDADEGAKAATRFDRAAALDPGNVEAAPYAQVALVRSGRVEQALQRATGAEPAIRAHTIALVAEYAPRHLRDALSLLDTATIEAGPEEQITELLVAIAAHVADEMPRVLALLPERGDLAAHIFNATARCEDALLRLAMLEFVVDLPEPESGPHREAFTYAHNNACILAHQLGDFARAAALADIAQQYAEENPYIFHGAACAYVAVGRYEDALRQVERAVARDYDHLDKLEIDEDLGDLRRDPGFIALFAGYRERLAHTEPVRHIGEAEFGDTVLASDVPVLVDFTATWCGPCQRQAPILDRLAHGAAGRFRVVKVDIDDNPELAEQYDATSVPTLVVFREGVEVGRRVGLSQRSELEALLGVSKADLN